MRIFFWVGRKKEKKRRWAVGIPSVAGVGRWIFRIFGQNIAPFLMSKKLPLGLQDFRGIIRLVARGIIKGSKRPFFAHTVPFFGHIARLYSLKKPSYGQKMTLFSLLADPAQQVYLIHANFVHKKPGFSAGTGMPGRANALIFGLYAHIADARRF